MTEPDEDVTELSTRNKESEDVTVLSSRVRSAAAAIDDDDETRMSARALAGQEETADITHLSRRSVAPDTRARTASGRRKATPPGTAGAAAQRGTFGQPPEEYDPREPPSAQPTQPHTVVAAPTTPGPVLGIEAARSRRESVRHRRLIAAVIVVGVTTAIMTAALLGIIALVRGR